MVSNACKAQLSFILTLGRKRERGDWGDASGNPPNKIPRPRLGEEMLRVLTRSSVCLRLRIKMSCILFFAGCRLYYWERRL